jgi:hypothetical protein
MLPPKGPQASQCAAAPQTATQDTITLLLLLLLRAQQHPRN